METFELNSKIELIKENEESFSGLIYDIKDDKLYVSVSADDIGFKILYEQENIQGIVYFQDEVVGFDCIISKRIYKDNPVYELSNLSNLYRVQRRTNVRIPYTRDILYTSDKDLINKIDTMEDLDQADINIYYEFNNGMILDISGGGIKLACDKDLYIRDPLYLRLNLRNEKVIVKGEIVHKKINRSSKKTKYIYGIKFIELGNRIKEKIIRFVFILMRKNLLKE